MTQKLIIHGRLPGYNQLNTGHWAARNRIKQHSMKLVGWHIKAQKIKPVIGKATVTIRCYESDRRRDPSNVRAGAEKILLDSLQECGIIRDDNARWLTDTPATVEYDKANPRVEIVIDGQTEFEMEINK